MDIEVSFEMGLVVMISFFSFSDSSSSFAVHSPTIELSAAYSDVDLFSSVLILRTTPPFFLL